MICVQNMSAMDKSTQASRSKAIDKSLSKDKQVLKSQVQMLLLGKPRSGKTTLIKQFRVKNGETFSQEELEAARLSLLDNITEAMRTLLTVREELVLPWANEMAEDDAVLVTCRSMHRLLADKGWKGIMSMMVRLWQEEGVQRAWQQSINVPGMDCLPRFLADHLRICDQRYCPSTVDMMYIYRTTQGVSECSVKGEASFRLVEMGGRSLTTPKLLHFFDNVNAVIFMASCAEVERRLVRLNLSNQGGRPASGSVSSSSSGSVGGGGRAESAMVFTSGFQESTEFFAMVAKDSSLAKLPIILLITKLDLLMDKVLHHRLDLSASFGADFKGDPTEVKDVQKHVVDVFRIKCAGVRPFYHHFMTCTDLHSVQEVFVEIKRDIRDSLLRKLLPQ